MLLSGLVKKKNYVFACWFFTKNWINFLFKVMAVGVKKATIISGFEIFLLLLYFCQVTLKNSDYFYCILY